MTKLTEAMRACLTYYLENENNPVRVQKPPYTWTMRQTNKALDNDWLMVGPGGWHILSPTGRALLRPERGEG